MKKYNVNAIINLYEQLNGYKKVNIAICDVHFLFKRFQNSYHGILVIDNTNTIILNKKNLQTIQDKVLKESHLPTDMPMNILTVIIDSFKISKTRYLTHNTCALDMVSGKVKHNSVCKELAKEEALLSIYENRANAQCSWIESIMDAPEKPHFIIMTAILTIINIFAFILFNTSKTDEYGISAGKILMNGESYRLFSYMFLHAGLLHLLGNTIALILYGKAYEKRNGALRTFTIYFFGGVYAGIISILTSVMTSNFDIITVGASGAIFAILGAYAAEQISEESINKSNNYSIIIYSIIMLISGFFRGNVDVACHIGGFTAGFIAHKIFIYAKRIAAKKNYISKTKSLLDTNMPFMTKRI